MDLIHSMAWKDMERDVIELFRQQENIVVSPLTPGLEAEVYLVSAAGSTYVLKIWNRQSRPDVALQYSILKHLYEQGAAVSRPYGWGEDKHGHQMLLTSYDGQPVRRLDESIITEMARMLNAVHRMEPHSMVNITLPKYDLVSYYFPGVEHHPDLRNRLNEMMQHAQAKHTHIIHGDYNLNNILELDGKLTIIDWTNIQLVDARFDIAWSVTLMRIYVNDEYAGIYHSAFRRLYPIDEREYEVFEALACLRWLLLERHGQLHYNDHIRRNVAAIVSSNRYLSEELLRDSLSIQPEEA